MLTRDTEFDLPLKATDEINIKRNVEHELKSLSSKRRLKQIIDIIRKRKYKGSSKEEILRV